MAEMTSQAVIYAAKSTDDPRGSIATQLADARGFAEREGLTVAEAYDDEAASAYHGNRGDGLARAREHAAELAAEHGSASLVVQHTDRLARGDGVAAQHLVEVLLWARKSGVRIRSVQDDSTGENVLMAAMMGERNHEDSKRKALATAAGRRRAAERGEWCGNVPDGYRIDRTVEGAVVARRIEFDPERVEVYGCLWGLALEGATVNAVVREMDARGYLTAPHKARPRSFGATRVDQVLRNPFYAGVFVYEGNEVATGRWPRYVEREDFERLRRERAGRTRHRPQPTGRPPGGILARLARCGACGGTAVLQCGHKRVDGTRPRRYVCATHMHRPHACDAKPWDADVAERTLLAHLDDVLADHSSWESSLTAGRTTERRRLRREVERAAKDVAEADRAIELLTDRYDAAVVANDMDEMELASRALARRRTTIERAKLRERAATDALAAVGDAKDDDPIRAVLEALNGALAGAEGDVKRVNAVLRDYLESVTLRHVEAGVQIGAVLSGERVAERLVHEPTAAYFSVINDDPDAPFENITFIQRAAGQRPSDTPQNPSPDSSPDTAGGMPRRNTSAWPGRPGRARL